MVQTVSIGGRLREERQRLGMNQTEFGEIGGVTKKTQMLYESGDRLPDAAYLAAAAHAGVDVLFVLTGSRSFTPAPAVPAEHRTLIADYEASSHDGKEAIRRMAAATALGASAIAGASRSRSHGTRKYLGPTTHQEFHGSAPVIGKVVTTLSRKKKS